MRIRWRWPLDPIVDYLGADPDNSGDLDCLADLLHIQRATVRIWRDRGIPEPRVEAVARAMGLPASALWPDRATCPLHWPLEPIAAHLEANLHRMGGHKPGDAPDGLRYIADVLGISERRARRWLDGGIPDEYADASACAAGAHPADLWPEWPLAVLSDEGDDGWFADDPELFVDEPHLEQAA